jgi:hypothetical protein
MCLPRFVPTPHRLGQHKHVLHPVVPLAQCDICPEPQELEHDSTPVSADVCDTGHPAEWCVLEHGVWHTACTTSAGAGAGAGAALAMQSSRDFEVCW